MDLGRWAVRLGREMVRLVLFDIDGTLIRTGGAGVAAFSRVAERLYGRPHGTAGLSFHGATDTGLVRDFLRAHDLADSEAERARFLEAYVFWLDHHLRRAGGEICPGVVATLAALRALPHRPMLGLLTGNIRLGAELKLRAHRLWDQFVVGGFGDDHEERDRIAEVARRRGEEALGRPVLGQEVLVIGDTPADVSCGRAIGARCLAVATGGVNLETLQRSRPDWLLPELSAARVAEICTG